MDKPEHASVENTIVVNHHFDFIDGFRGMAVLLVIWFHASYFTHDLMGGQIETGWHYYYVLSLLGQSGVDLFFVISGFLITGILIDIRHQDQKFRKFYIRRSLRIFPLYFVSVFVILFVFSFALQDVPDAGKTLAHLLYVQNWSLEHNKDMFMYLNHTWSLAVEEQFYLIWPIMFWSIYNKSPAAMLAVIAALIVFSWGARLYLAEAYSYKLALTATFCRFDTLAGGALLAILYKRHYDLLEKGKPFFIGLIFISSLLMMILLFSQNDAGAVHKSINSIGLSVLSVFYVSLFAYFLVIECPSFLSCKLLKETGRISYGCYIIHTPIIMILSQIIVPLKIGYPLGHASIFIITVILTFLLANFSYNSLEKPMLKLKNKWAPY